MTVDIAIIGAGPYGLAAARRMEGMDVKVFGRPMSFWRDHMPQGMFLRSPRQASSLAPMPGLRLEDYEHEHGLAPAKPLPIETFVDYTMWFQERAVPDVDPRCVERVDVAGGGRFRLTLEDGEEVFANRVVVAAGVGPFAWRPEEYAELPQDLVSHTVEHRDLGAFRGKRVAVIGGGQSAVESTALLAENGAEVELIARARAINWLVRSNALHATKALRPFLYGPSDIGPAGVSWLVEWPGVFRRIPRKYQDPLARRAIRPAASAWLIPRTEAIPLTLGRSVASVRATANGSGPQVALTLDDGTARTVDHVLLATGYRVDISRYAFLDRSMLAGIATAGGSPRLRRGFESTIPGLHFLGATSAWSFGPLFRFVAGVDHAARGLTDAVRGPSGAASNGSRAAATGGRSAR
jgi:cation diffusion facilitator CzcD-associated flavoprotein CzcO